MVAEDNAAAFVIAGAGVDDANGLYVPTGKVLYGAPIFENDKRCLLSREPHNDSATGRTAFGWVLGRDRMPLYAAKSEALAPPEDGWRLFKGAKPLPKLQGAGTVGNAAVEAAQVLKDQGNALFAAKRFEEAEAKWTRAIKTANHQPEAAIAVALYSNRAEARLRLQQWEAALSDAEKALRGNRTHDKALLRAAVAARELKMYTKARDFAKECVDAHPSQPEAKTMLLELDAAVQAQQRAMFDRPASGKVEEEWKRRDVTLLGALDSMPKAFATKDTNNKKGFLAFAGYGQRRDTSGEERAPVSKLPYHNMNFPPEKVAEVDQMVQDLRVKADEEERAARESQRAISATKAEYKMRAKERMAMGQIQPVDEILPSEKKAGVAAIADAGAPEAPKATALAVVPAKTLKAEHLSLAAQDVDEVDALFATFTSKPAPAAAERTDRKAKLAAAKARLRETGAPKQLLALTSALASGSLMAPA